MPWSIASKVADRSRRTNRVALCPGLLWGCQLRQFPSQNLVWCQIEMDLDNLFHPGAPGTVRWPHVWLPCPRMEHSKLADNGSDRKAPVMIFYNQRWMTASSKRAGHCPDWREAFTIPWTQSKRPEWAALLSHDEQERSMQQVGNMSVRQTFMGEISTGPFCSSTRIIPDGKITWIGFIQFWKSLSVVPPQ